MISRSLPAYTPEELIFRGPLVPRGVATTFIAVQFLNRPHRVGDRRKLCRSAAGDMDLAITDYDIQPLPPPAGLVRRLLFPDPVKIVLPADHPLAEQRVVHLGEVDPAEWIRTPVIPQDLTLLAESPQQIRTDFDGDDFRTGRDWLMLRSVWQSCRFLR